jgi:type I restriction enzyme S subunit
MKSNYKKLGDFIQQVKKRNNDNSLTVDNLRGINISKEFMPSVANVTGTDLSVYKVVEKNQFAYNPMHVGRDEILPISMLVNEDKVIVSPAYVIFEIVNTDKLLPEYLMIWCRRREFDRNAWFTTDSSVRGGFNWEDFCDLELPVPTLEKQKEIIKEYHTITDRIKLNEQLNKKLEDTAQSIYKEWFVNFEFPDENGKPYKSNGGEMIYCEELEMEMPYNFRNGYLEEIIDIFDSQRIPLSGFDRENMKKIYPYFGAASLMDYVEDFIFDGTYILLGEDGTVETENGYPVLQYVYGKFWVNNHAHILKGKNGFDENSLFVLLNNTNISNIITGGVQAKISQTNLKTVKISIPPQYLIQALNKKLKPIFNLKIQTLEIQKICFKLKEILLSKMATIEG